MRTGRDQRVRASRINGSAPDRRPAPAQSSTLPARGQTAPEAADLFFTCTGETIPHRSFNHCRQGERTPSSEESFAKFNRSHARPGRPRGVQCSATGFRPPRALPRRRAPAHARVRAGKFRSGAPVRSRRRPERATPARCAGGSPRRASRRRRGARPLRVA